MLNKVVGVEAKTTAFLLNEFEKFFVVLSPSITQIIQNADVNHHVQVRTRWWEDTTAMASKI